MCHFVSEEPNHLGMQNTVALLSYQHFVGKCRRRSRSYPMLSAHLTTVTEQSHKAAWCTTHRRDNNGQFKKCSSKAVHQSWLQCLQSKSCQAQCNKASFFERKISVKKIVHFVILRSDLGLRRSSDTRQFCCFP